MTAGEGCDCTELCSMGPTCPGGMLARLPGSGCHRTTTPEEQAADVLLAAIQRLEGDTDRPQVATQTWERHIPGTDVALTRIHLDVDDTGRALVHEALLAQLLLEGGWERTA